jgi:beta-lactamase class A
VNAASPQAGKEQLLVDHLNAAIKEAERRVDGVLRIAILDLTTGQELTLHADDVFPHAASIKIAVLAELYHQIEQAWRGATGKADLADRHVARAADLVPGSDILGGAHAGRRAAHQPGLRDDDGCGQ